MPKPKVLAVVQARSGSKGVPGKNVRLLMGKPLMGWILEAAKRCRNIDRLVLSTDSPEYAEIGRSFGAETPFLRPAEFAGDTAVDLQVLTHALGWLKRNEGYVPDVTVRLQPTNPTFPTELIDQGIEMLLGRPEADSLRPVAPAPKHPYKMWRWASGSKGEIEPFIPASQTGLVEAHNLGRNQLPPALIQIGAMEAVRTNVILEKKSMAGSKVIGLLVGDPLLTVNIDTELDFLLAEAALRNLLALPKGANA